MTRRQPTPSATSRPRPARRQAARRRPRPRVQVLGDDELARDRVAQAVLAGLLQVPLDVDLDAVKVRAGSESALRGWLDGYCALLRLPGHRPARTLPATPRAAARQAGAIADAQVRQALAKAGDSPYTWSPGLTTRQLRRHDAPELLEAALRIAVQELPAPAPRRRRLEHQLCRLWLAEGGREQASVYLAWRGPHRGAWQVGVWDERGRLLLTASAHRPGTRPAAALQVIEGGARTRRPLPDV